MDYEDLFLLNQDNDPVQTLVDVDNELEFEKDPEALVADPGHLNMDNLTYHPNLRRSRRITAVEAPYRYG